MRALFRLSILSSALVSAGLLLSSSAARAQTATPTGAVAPRGYDFLTVTAINGLTKNTSKMLITPSFQGETEVQLEDLSGSSLAIAKDMAIEQHNIMIVNKKLGDLSAAGWELAQVYAVEQTTHYLLRKARN